MTTWLTPLNRSLLSSLLDELAATDPPGENEAFPLIDHAQISMSAMRACLREALESGDESGCQRMVEQMAGENTPFMLFSYHLGLLRNQLCKLALGRNMLDDIRQVIEAFERMEEGFAAAYLQIFLNRLGTRNHLRLRHILALSDKNILAFFENHLLWMGRLVESVRARSVSDMPELDPTRCQFGRWLDDDGARLIRDRSHTAQIRQLHESMHHVVAEVSSILNHSQASGPLYALLKKAETYSLELGNEISLLNNIVIMSVFSKDPLTGFLSRRFLDKVLINQMEIAKATETPFSLIMFDLDHFKRINDLHGHQTGDRALEHVAALVRDTLRQSDLVFRYGGEEFLLVSPSTSLHQARQLAEKLRQRIAETPLPGEPPIPITASFGVTEVSPGSYEVVDTRLLHEVIAACDGKLYAAKHNGRNQVI